MFKKGLVCLLTTALLLIPLNVMAQGNWQDVVLEIKANLQNAVHMYQQGKISEAKELVNDAYFGPFETERMEAAISSRISVQRAADIEYEFTLLKKTMEKKAYLSKVKETTDSLVSMLNEDAKTLQGNSEHDNEIWYYSILILLGMIVMSAVIYKKNHKKKSSSTNSMGD